MERLRIATFNIENLQFEADSTNPPLAQRIPVLRDQLRHLNADVLCLQEINGQLEEEGVKRRQLLALRKLLEETSYCDYHLAGTYEPDLGSGYALESRNIVTLSRFPFRYIQQLFHDLVTIPFRQNTAIPSQKLEEIAWHRPFLHTEIELPRGKSLHVINLHLKSPLPSTIVGQQEGGKWRSLAGRAESELLSTIKRAGQALEVRRLLDRLFKQDACARIVVCGDFNAESHELPVKTVAGQFSRVNNPKLVGQELVACEQLVRDEQRFTHTFMDRRATIDHMLVSRSLNQRILTCEILNQDLIDPANSASASSKRAESDHAPILGIFQM